MNDAPTLFAQDVTEPNPGQVRHSDPETSQDMAADPSSRIRWGSERFLLLSAFNSEAALFVDGLTDEGAASWVLTNHHNRIDSVEATRRCSELRKYGLIEPTGQKRPKRSGNAAMVCRITTAGRDALYAARCAK